MYSTVFLTHYIHIHIHIHTCICLFNKLQANNCPMFILSNVRRSQGNVLVYMSIRRSMIRVLPSLMDNRPFISINIELQAPL